MPVMSTAPTTQVSSPQTIVQCPEKAGHAASYGCSSDKRRSCQRRFAGRWVRRFRPMAIGLYVSAALVAQRTGILATSFAQEPSRLRWHVTETENFRILHYGICPVDQNTAAKCEKVRTALCKQWFPKQTPGAWTPKCSLVLHPSDSSYLREVGSGGGNTVASALVERGEGRITLRRVDVRSETPGWMTGAFAHELAHVVVADHFKSQPLPRWLDEGIAILSDSKAKRSEHVSKARNALNQGQSFRLVELLSLTDYPPAGRWGTFYDQSAALVDFLVEARGHADLIRFSQLVLDTGYEHALQEVYGWDIREFERQWSHTLIAQHSGTQPRTLLVKQSRVVNHSESAANASE